MYRKATIFQFQVLMQERVEKMTADHLEYELFEADLRNLLSPYKFLKGKTTAIQEAKNHAPYKYICNAKKPWQFLLSGLLPSSPANLN